MPLLFHSKPGTIVVCDYRTGFRPPEMVKRRPVIVVSPRLRRRNGLCTVVPLSTQRPEPVEDYHCEINLPRALPPPFGVNPMWAKCDMLATLGFARLELLRAGKDRSGKRKYIQPVIGTAALMRVRTAVLASLGISID